MQSTFLILTTSPNLSQTQETRSPLSCYLFISSGYDMPSWTRNHIKEEM